MKSQPKQRIKIDDRLICLCHCYYRKIGSYMQGIPKKKYVCEFKEQVNIIHKKL